MEYQIETVGASYIETCGNVCKAHSLGIQITYPYEADEDTTTNIVSYEKARLMQRLESLKTLEVGWDGYGALPIAEGAYNNMRSMIKAVSPEMLSRWRLFPGKNGSLSLETNDGQVAGISIGATTMSYGLVTDGGREETWQGAFDVTTAGEILGRINQLLDHEER